MRGSISEEGVLRKLLEHMNSQVPSKRMKLSDLLAMADPRYIGRDGAEYMVSREELELVKDSLAFLQIGDIRLPIVLIADSSQEQSVWRIEGESECALVQHLLGKSDKERKERIFLYPPHIAVLRRKLPTTTVCMLVPGPA
jgi:uncharacterized protein (UPF0216 family)